LGPGKLFRILILEPENVQRESSTELEGRLPKGSNTLSCRLKLVSSFQDEEYEALSYVWGQSPKSEDKVMDCGGHTIRIKPNLALALRRLRLPDKERALWVDAICINQDDLREKSLQVSLMREIYANAQQVIIWLGDDQDNVDCDKHAFDLLTSLFAYFNDGTQGETGRNAGARGPSTSNQTWVPLPAQYSEKSKHLANLLCREWFTRTWVVQEIASAQKAVVMGGSEMISWDVFTEVLKRFRTLQCMQTT
jgi:hypothetical protein